METFQEQVSKLVVTVLVMALASKHPREKALGNLRATMDQAQAEHPGNSYSKALHPVVEALKAGATPEQLLAEMVPGATREEILAALAADANADAR